MGFQQVNAFVAPGMPARIALREDEERVLRWLFENGAADERALLRIVRDTGVAGPQVFDCIASLAEKQLIDVAGRTIQHVLRSRR